MQPITIGGSMQKLIWPVSALALALVLAVAAFMANPADAQDAKGGAGGGAAGGDSALKEIERYRAALADGNPAELWEARGEDLWKQKRGPNKVSFESCDLGMGPGVV